MKWNITPESRRKRKEDMLYLRFELKWTCQEIADKYHISRERVGQIIGRTGNHFKTKRIDETIATSTHLTNDELAQKLNLSPNNISARRNGTRHAIKHGAVSKGTNIENLVSKIMNENGIENTLMPHHSKYDIELKNKKTVEIKASFIKIKPPSQHGNGYFHFRIRATQHKHVDFYVFVIVPTKDIFVVPSGEITGNSNIRIPWPKSRKSSKWHKHHNRFDLMK